MPCRSYPILLFLIASASFAQTKTTKLVFNPVFGNSDLQLNGPYYKLNKADSVRIEVLKFYISGIALVNNDKVTWKEENSFHLLDASDESSLSISLKIPTAVAFTKVKFNLGIDSITNVSGAMGGDLDPTKGMYWTWQSGYINFKLEGKSNLCQIRNNEFHFHLGGYQHQDNALRSLTFDVNGNEKTEISLDISKLLSSLDLSKQNQIMSPGKEAIGITEKALRTFSAKQP